jgi:hypothetical protein
MNGRSKSFFPIVIEYTEGPNKGIKRLVPRASLVPIGVAFIVLETNVMYSKQELIGGNQ